MVLPRIADFVVERELGSGAMGTVYLARRDGVTYAVKVIRPELVGEGDFVARLQREADVGTHVVHRNVVRTLASGTTETGGATLHYLVMEYVEGKDLRTLLRELGTCPEALLREVAGQLAAGLEAIHGAGVVHRDLKPENVLITQAHEVRIMDLGVARFRDAASTLTQEGDFTGTLLYAAPEAFVSASVGPAADLYALGVLLYELASGTNPFESTTSLGVMRAQVELVPPTLRERVSTVSAFFAEVVATLMAKRPDARFRSAADLRRTLTEAEASAWWREREPLVARAARRLPPIPVDRPTAVYGRDAELEALRSAFAAATRGSGGAVRLEGEAGIGKTRLLDELVRGLGEGRRHVLYGAFGPFGGLGGICEAVVGLLGPAELERNLRGHLDAHADLVPALAARLRDECPPVGVAPLLADALPTLLVRLLQSLADDAPVLWLVEDVHLAREEGRRLLTALARAAAGRRVLFVVTTQEGGAAEGEPPVLDGLPGLVRLPLARLAERDVVALLTEALGSELLATSLGARVAARSDGVPLVVHETLRAFGETGVLKRAADGTYVQVHRLTSVPLPASLRGLVELRLQGLADEDREILDVAAVLGTEFDALTVARVLEATPVLVLRRLAVLERRTGLVRATGPRFRFDRRSVQEELYARLPSELRAEYHALVAEAIEGERGAKLEGRDAYLVAVHHLKGARPRAALPWFDAALAYLERASLNDELFDTVDAALARPGLFEGTARAELLLRLAARLLPVAGVAETLPAVREALALAEASGDASLRARSHFVDARATAMAGDPEGARAGFARARDLAREVGDVELEARAIGSIGVALDNTGRHEEGLPMLEHHLAGARRAGDRRSEMIAACNLGLCLHHLRRDDEALEMMNLHRTLAVALGDVRAEAAAYGNLSLLASKVGDAEAACAHLERNIELARRTGARTSEAAACINLAVELDAAGRVDRALALLTHSRALAHELGDPRSEASAEWNLGAVWARVGHWDEALSRYERAVALLRAAGDVGGTADALLQRARVLSALGRPSEERACVEEALGLARSVGLTATEAEALIDLAGTASRAGDVASAEARLREAEAKLGDRASPVLEARRALVRAALPGGDAAAAERAVSAAAPRETMTGGAERYFRLWEVTGTPAHLERARALLDAWAARLSPTLRDGLEQRVPLYGAIRAGVPSAR